MSDNYEKICKERFDRLESRQESMGADISAIREKVFDGFGESIKRLNEEMRNLRIWIIGFCGSVILLLFGAAIKLIFFG